MDCCAPMPPSRRFLAVRRVARLRADYLASKPNISASRVLADWETFRELAPHVDLFLYDIKHMDDEAHRRLTGAGNRRILDNLHGLFRMGKKVLIRMPLIPGLNDDPAGLEAAFAMLREEAAQGADIAGVELLPYHRYGEGKYRQLGRAYPCGAEPYPEERLEELKAFLAARSTEGLPLRLVRHA